MDHTYEMELPMKFISYDDCIKIMKSCFNLKEYLKNVPTTVDYISEDVYIVYWSENRKVYASVFINDMLTLDCCYKKENANKIVEVLNYYKVSYAEYIRIMKELIKEGVL